MIPVFKKYVNTQAVSQYFFFMQKVSIQQLFPQKTVRADTKIVSALNFYKNLNTLKIFTAIITTIKPINS